jgi:RHS repeat-associated protein
MFDAARITDPIAHTSALAGFLVGAIIGIALIAAVAFATFTCGFGVALLAGLVAGVGASAILSLGENIGKMFSSPSGTITLGSPNVFVNSLASAFATASVVACSKHNPTALVAEGSGNVFINSLPAARKGDATTCGAKIDKGSDNTFIGGGTVRYLDVQDEVPPWLRTAVDWAFALAGLVGGLAGLLKAAGGLSRAVLPCAAKFIGGFIIGETVSRLVIGPVISKVVGGLFGNPVDVTTGRKLLLASEETDFVLASPVPLECGRFYGSNLTRVGALGKGWVLPWELRLQRRDGQLWLRDAQGRESGFPIVMPGHSAFHDVEQKYLACTAQGRYILYDLSETYFDFGAMAQASTGKDDPDETLLLQRIEDQTGHWLEFHRTGSSDNVSLIMTSGGQQLRLSYLHAMGRLTDIELVHNRKRETLVQYGYDADGQLNRVTDANGHVSRRFEYTAGLMSAHSNALGFKCSYVWGNVDGQPRVMQTRTSEGEQASFSYDIAARKTSVVDELGRTAQWTYNEHFLVTECVDLDGKCYRTEYNDAGQPTTIHLPAEEGEERKVSLAYDQAGRIVAETDVLGRCTSTRYHRNSLRPEAVTGSDGSQWKAEYDHIGRLLKTIDALGHETSYAYPDKSASPWPVTLIDAKGGKKQLTWSRSGQLTAYTDCSGKTTRYEHDIFGNVTAITNALDQTTRVQRLPTGQPKTIVTPDGTQEEFEYDAARLLVKQIDSAGHTQSWHRNARGQVLKAIDAAERALNYRYDERGRLVEMTSGNSENEAARYQFAYDAGDRLAEENRPDGVKRRLSYGVFGQALTLEMIGSSSNSEARATRTTTFERDKLGRLLAQSNDTATTSYGWDAADRLIKAQRQPTAAGHQLGINANTVNFQYDNAGRLIAEKTKDGSVGYELDELGNLTALNLPHEQHISWLTYGSGHVHQIRCGEDIIADIERDDIHREVQRTQGKLTMGLGYDALGRKTWQSAVQAMANSPSMPGPAQGKLWRTYRYSAEGELAEQSDNTRGALQFQYDPAGQLLKRTSANTAADSKTSAEQFAWDAAGNLLDDIQRKSTGRVEGNRLAMWQDTRFEYDPWGNLKTKRKGSRQTQHFTFDADNRLVTVRTESPRGAEETTFEYDALGRRIGKTDKHIEASGTSHTEHKRFVWQGMRMVQELRESGLSNYIYSTESPYTPLARVDTYIGELPAKVQADGAIEQAKRTSRIFYFHTDLVGAPLEVTDELGDLAWTGDYSAWGKLDSTSARASDARIDQPLRYPGQYADESTGLHYNTFRYYDPDIGRFISQDPIGLRGGENLYSYAPNPTGWIDPWGWINLNTNGASGDFGIYKIDVNGELYKFGKADLGRVTESSGQPTRLHQQLRKLGEIHGEENVRGQVIESGHETTAKAKVAETTRLQEHFEKTGQVPEGNKKSFKPKSGGC